MATGQSLLDIMEVVNQELQLQSGEDDVTKGLVALNAAQDAFEGLAALRPNIFGSDTDTVTTTVNTETTTFPSGFLRIDKVQHLDSNSRPDYDLEPIRKVGGHSWNRYWPLSLSSSASSGKPRGYYTNGRSIYWSPLPDATHTLRVYGFKQQATLTAAGTFQYPDVVMLPMAAFAARLFKIGLDDPDQPLANLAGEIFTPVIAQLGNFVRDGSSGLEYTQAHTT